MPNFDAQLEEDRVIRKTTCHHCGKLKTEEHTLKICKCRQVRYCNIECQKAAWATHRAMCKKWQKIMIKIDNDKRKMEEEWIIIFLICQDLKILLTLTGTPTNKRIKKSKFCIGFTFDTDNSSALWRIYRASGSSLGFGRQYSPPITALMSHHTERSGFTVVHVLYFKILTD